MRSGTGGMTLSPIPFGIARAATLRSLGRIARISNMKITVELTEEDRWALYDWEHNHECKLRDNEIFPGQRYVGAAGGATSYWVIPTGLGDCVGAKCACGSTLDLTDTSNW